MICDFRIFFFHDSIMISFRKIAMLLIIHDINIDDVVWLNFEFNHLIDLLSRDKYAQIVNEFSQLANHFQWNWFSIFSNFH